MKQQFKAIIISLIIIFVIILIMVIIKAKEYKKSQQQTQTTTQKTCDSNVNLAPPPAGKQYTCVNGNWILTDIK